MSDLERKLLLRLTQPGELSSAWDAGLRADVFEDPMCRAAFTTAVGYWLDSQMTSAPTSEVLEREMEGLVLPTQVEETTDWLVNYLTRRAAANKFQAIVRDTSAFHREDPLKALQQMYLQAYEATVNTVRRSVHEDVLSAASIEERRQRYLREASHDDAAGTGVTLGVDALDQHTSGLRPGELCAVAAFSKVGKTMFLVNAAVRARREGHTPALFTLEMSKPEINDRVDAMLSGVSYNRLSKRTLEPAELDQLDSARREFSELGSLHVLRPDEGDRSTVAMVNAARRLGADYIIIDQLSFMETGQKYRDLKGHHAAVLRELTNEIGRGGAEIPCLLAAPLIRATL